MKFFKIAALWLFVLVATIAFGEWSASIGLEWLAKILAASLYGHFIMLVTSFLMATFVGKGISVSVWWTAAFHVLTCSFVEEQDLQFMFGPFLGIALSYWLLRKSGQMLSRQPNATA
jgi:hypothetical protein